eukprot:2938826-Amphidinium_carterae.1
MSNDEEELPSHETWKHVETLRPACTSAMLLRGEMEISRDRDSMVYGHRSTELLDFVKKFGFGQSLLLELQKYGSSGPHLVRLLHHRLVHLWRHWLESGQPASYPRESLPAYECSVALPETLVLNAAA